MNTHEPMTRYFSGEALYGDDFEGERLARWYAGEREGYASEVMKRTEAYRYKYHEINRFYGYRHLSGRTGLEVLGIGSAYGDELLPIAPQVRSFDIIEPSDECSDNREIDGVPAVYHKASLCDFAPFVRVVDNAGFDCFGTPVLTRMDRILSMIFGFNRNITGSGRWRNSVPHRCSSRCASRTDERTERKK